MSTKAFPLRTVLTVTTGRLLTTPKGKRDSGIDDAYEILGWMTDDSPFTHQLPRFADECKPWLLRWFPELAWVETLLADLDSRLAKSADRSRAIDGWLASLQEMGIPGSYDVPKIPRDDHEVKDPYDEMVIMRGTDEGIVLVDPPTEVQP